MGLAPASTFAAPGNQPPAEPVIGAKAAIVVDYATGRILYSKGMHERLAPASTTKILTAILAMESGNLDEVITVAPKDLVRGSKMGLRSGENQTLRSLLYGLLIPSGNDAAMTIARALGARAAAKAGAKAADPINYFAEMMNRRAADFGLTDTHFVNPHGLDKPGHYSSAYDLASLTWYAMHFPLFNEIVRHPNYQAPGHLLKNTNKMLTQYPGAEGAKTGYTRRAGLCLITSATRNGRRIISVVLNAPKWIEDSTALLDYGFAKLASGPVRSQVISIARRSAIEPSHLGIASHLDLDMLAAVLSEEGETAGPLTFPSDRIFCTWGVGRLKLVGARSTLFSGA
jgi:D-alanyl-D-alanine carboxypeptidase (penicillin-binding protein 5/6)